MRRMVSPSAGHVTGGRKDAQFARRKALSVPGYRSSHSCAFKWIIFPSLDVTRETSRPSVAKMVLLRLLLLLLGLSLASAHRSLSREDVEEYMNLTQRFLESGPKFPPVCWKSLEGRSREARLSFQRSNFGKYKEKVELCVASPPRGPTSWKARWFVSLYHFFCAEYKHAVECAGFECDNDVACQDAPLKMFDPETMRLIKGIIAADNLDSEFILETTNVLTDIGTTFLETMTTSLAEPQRRRPDCIAAARRTIRDNGEDLVKVIALQVLWKTKEPPRDPDHLPEYMDILLKERELLFSSLSCAVSYRFIKELIVLTNFLKQCQSGKIEVETITRTLLNTTLLVEPEPLEPLKPQLIKVIETPINA